MKLRIRDNTLRLRLTQGEVGSVAGGREVCGRMPLPDGSAFEYRLAGGDAVGEDVALDGKSLTVSVDPVALAGWARSDDVSLRAQVEGPAGTLEVLIEKDFACLSPRAGEDDVDTFPNPKAGSSGC